MIILHTMGETLSLDEAEAQGWAEMLEAEGIPYTFERDEEPAPAAAGAAEFLFFEGDGRREPTVTQASLNSRDALRAEELRLAEAYAASQAELAASAQELGMPAWALQCKQQLALAREWGKDPEKNFGIVRRRETRYGGGWYYYDASGKSTELPEDAGSYFKDGQTA